MLRVATFNLEQDKCCTVYRPVPNRLPVISLSARFHDKTVETADNPVYNVFFFFFFFFFVNVFFFFFFVCVCVFKRVSTQPFRL